MKKVKEIKEALKHNEYFAIEYVSKSGEPKIFTFTDLLTLINELESENERLLNEKWDKEDDLDNYHEENQQLKDRIAELEKGNANLLQVINDLENIDTKLQNTCAICETELKQFAERLKDKIGDIKQFFRSCLDRDYCGLTEDQIDETLKEFIDGKV